MNPPLCAYCPACGRENRENVAHEVAGTGSALTVNGQPCCAECLDAIVNLYHSSGRELLENAVERTDVP